MSMCIFFVRVTILIQSILAISNVTEKSFNFNYWKQLMGIWVVLVLTLKKVKIDQLQLLLMVILPKVYITNLKRMMKKKPCIITFAQLEEGVLEINESVCDYFKRQCCVFWW